MEVWVMEMGEDSREVAKARRGANWRFALRGESEEPIVGEGGAGEVGQALWMRFVHWATARVHLKRGFAGQPRYHLIGY